MSLQGCNEHYPFFVIDISQMFDMWYFTFIGSVGDSFIIYFFRPGTICIENENIFML